MSESESEDTPHGTPLRRGWTTGACATAATRAALGALLDGRFIDPVTITLPGGQTPSFALAHEARGEGYAEAGIIKDAGDDPDVTHGTRVVARVAPGTPGRGVTFHAGPGVGTVTKPGLPLDVGEPAINPVPRRMMTEVVTELCERAGRAPDIAVTISIPNGERIAEKTWNPRLGILGGLSILGTTGIVIPYSCSSWIHSIHRGVDVARALGLTHLVGATGERSETAARSALGLPEEAFIDMGDFAGGFLKYLRQHPVEEVTIAGGFAKLTKLAQGALDLHSARSTVDFDALAGFLADLGASAPLIADARAANTANEVAALAEDAGVDLAGAVARSAREKAQQVLGGNAVRAHILIVNRSGRIMARSDQD